MGGDHPPNFLFIISTPRVSLATILRLHLNSKKWIIDQIVNQWIQGLSSGHNSKDVLSGFYRFMKKKIRCHQPSFYERGDSFETTNETWNRKTSNLLLPCLVPRCACLDGQNPGFVGVEPSGITIYRYWSIAICTIVKTWDKWGNANPNIMGQQYTYALMNIPQKKTDEFWPK